MSNFKFMRELLCNLGISAPQSDENLFDAQVISSIKSMVKRILRTNGEREARIKELEQERKDLIEEFAEAECMGDLAKTARNHGYKG